MPALTAVVLRSAVLVLVFELPRLLPIGSEDGLGLGLAVFTALALVSLVWSAVDGRRAGVGPGVLRWGIVAVLTGLVASVIVAVPGAGWSDVADLAPFLAVLVAVPAVVGLLVGAGVRRARAR